MMTFHYMMRLKRLCAVALFAATFQAHASPTPLSAADAREIATEAYIYAYPLVLMDVTRRVSTNVARPVPGTVRAPVNQFGHMTVFPDDKFDLVVRPNADTLYSTLWFDVSREPVIVSVPDSGERYYLLPALDMWTDVFMSPGTRTTGNGAQRFAIIGPHWQGKLPAGLRTYVAPTSEGWLIGRTQTNGAKDYPAVRKFQTQWKVVPLSAYGSPGYVPPAQNVDSQQDMSAPVDQVDKMDGPAFFARFAELLQKNPPHANDYPSLDRIARIGLVPGQSFDWNGLPPQTQAAIEAAPAEGRKAIDQAAFRSGTLVNGWRMPSHAIGTYGTDYLQRALVARRGLGANTVEDAIYPMGLLQDNGKPFDSNARYVIHFDKAQLPPVRAFWSLALYNERQLFTSNPIHRFSIGDRDPLKYNPDGSLDLLIQCDQPASGDDSNWLPSPAAGSFTLTLRLYWPQPSVLDGVWKPPVVRQVDE